MAADPVPEPERVGAATAPGIPHTAAALAACAFPPNFWLAKAVLVVAGLCPMAFFPLKHHRGALQHAAGVPTGRDEHLHADVLAAADRRAAALPPTDLYGARPAIGTGGVVLGLFVVAMSRVLRTS